VVRMRRAYLCHSISLRSRYIVDRVVCAAADFS
jgi:hypothetical protein